jgi:colanic acid biosynthesis glycosyl transferase WcaI
MHVQLWTAHFPPEPIGIAPVCATLTRALADRGHRVDVIASHPHYPHADWGRRLRPYRERRDGARVLRLPLWTGRDTPFARVRQEVSIAASLAVALPAVESLLGRADAMVVVSPSFPALGPALAHARRTSTPLVLWLQDILPDGASASGILDEDRLLVRASRRLERAAYAGADRIVLISHAFERNLLDKGIDPGKLELIYQPATRGVRGSPPDRSPNGPPRILSMGNIGETQGLAPLVRAFEASEALARQDARLIITGGGVAADRVASEVRSGRVEMLGVVPEERLESELRSASLALVPQSYEGPEFNLPSKLMNFMAYGLPVLAAVNPGGEVARLVEEADAGWIADSSDPDAFPAAVERALSEPSELSRRGRAAYEFARANFSPEQFADAFETLLAQVATRS